jgi:hypothetical protein
LLGGCLSDSSAPQGPAVERLGAIWAGSGAWLQREQLVVWDWVVVAWVRAVTLRLCCAGVPAMLQPVCPSPCCCLPACLPGAGPAQATLGLTAPRPSCCVQCSSPASRWVLRPACAVYAVLCVSCWVECWAAQPPCPGHTQSCIHAPSYLPTHSLPTSACPCLPAAPLPQGPQGACPFTRPLWLPGGAHTRAAPGAALPSARCLLDWAVLTGCRLGQRVPAWAGLGFLPSAA